MENCARKWLLLGIVFVVIVISGCQSKGAKDVACNSTDEDPKDHLVGILSDGRMPDSDGEHRRQVALSKLQNGVVDPTPILLFAQVIRPVGYEQVRLSLLIFDEDSDVLGFGINEECQDVSGNGVVRLEEYPAFIHQDWSHVLCSKSVPVQIRDEDQKKDGNRWNEYVANESLNDLTSRIWTETLPPVWISIPEPNNVDVSVYLYDRAGHKSEPVKVLNRL